MSHTRKLAAIMFTDIVGYTALMQQSEQAALEIRKRHREIFESTTATHGGRIIQYYGDGTLSIFDSSVAAVHCGIELQLRFQTEPVVPVRIGLHTGDILISELDIIGDSVNLASRIESMGVPGSVLVSGKVAEEIKNQDDLPLLLLGKFHFKNDDRERQVFALNVPGLVIPKKKDMQGKLRKTNKGSRKKITQFVLLPLVIGFLGIFGWQVSNLGTKTGIERIGVLPFFNRMNDPEQDQLVDGVHEALISELQQAGISVKGRTSMMHYRNTKTPVVSIADELSVNALIEGSVYRADDSIGVTIRLIDGESEDIIWSNSFETGFQDVTGLYQEVTREIASEIHQALSPEVIKRLKVHKPVNPEAYKAYLIGQQYWYTLNEESLETALYYFELALEIDPEYAPAHAGIAAVWGGRLQQGFVSYTQATPIIIRSIGKALALDNELPEVQFWYGTINTWWLWDWEIGEKAFVRSLELNPNYAEAHAYFSHFLYIQNRPKEAQKHMNMALELDPFNPLLKSLYGMTQNYGRRYEEVIEVLTQTMEKSPEDPMPLSTLRTTFHLAGRYEEALDIWRKYYQIRKDSVSMAILEKGYQEGGYSLALQRLAELLVERSKLKHVSPFQIATLYTRAGKSEEALDWLEKAYLEHDANMPYLAIDPIFDEIRTHPRFRTLLQKMDLLQNEGPA